MDWRWKKTEDGTWCVVCLMKDDALILVQVDADYVHFECGSLSAKFDVRDIADANLSKKFAEAWLPSFAKFLDEADETSSIVANDILQAHARQKGLH